MTGVALREPDTSALREDGRASAELRTEWVDRIDDVRAMAGEWDAAVVASGEDNPFLLSAFLLSWWTHRAGRRTPAVFIVRRGGRIVGGLPLCQSPDGTLEHMGEHAANYTEFLRVDWQVDLWPLFLRALATRPGWRRVVLARIRQHRLGLAPGPAGAQADLVIDAAHTNDTFLIDLPSPGPSSRHIRHQVRKSQRDAARWGTLRLQTDVPESELPALIETFLRLSRASFRARGMTSLFEDPTMRSFFAELIHAFARAGRLDVQVLRLHDDPLAINMGYTLGGNHNYIWVTINPRYARLRPGHLMIAALLEHAAQRGDRVFDFYAGYYRYKAAWCTRTLPVWRVDIRRNTLAGRMGLAIVRGDRALRQFVKSQPRLYGAAIAWRASLRRVRRATEGGDDAS